MYSLIIEKPAWIVKRRNAGKYAGFPRQKDSPGMSPIDKAHTFSGMGFINMLSFSACHEPESRMYGKNHRSVSYFLLSLIAACAALRRAI
ncbi:MAG: hypothetical protein ACI4WX_07930, partial [Aristaeellaceae bacterium]